MKNFIEVPVLRYKPSTLKQGEMVRAPDGVILIAVDKIFFAEPLDSDASCTIIHTVQGPIQVQLSYTTLRDKLYKLNSFQ